MSCCGSNCGCGSACKCGSGCGGCKMHPEMAEEATNTTQAVIMGVAPSKDRTDGFEAGAATGAVKEACKCGSNCTCDPCNC